MIGAITAGLFSSGVAAATNSYESIATATGTGSSGSISFASIPSTYKHLQLRASWDTTPAAGYLTITVNSGTAPTKSHALYGDGSAANAAAFTNVITLENGYGQPYAGIIDILDYTDTNKNKTIRTLFGGDRNGVGIVGLTSAYIGSTSAISQITIALSSNNFTSTTKFALYGIKG